MNLIALAVNGSPLIKSSTAVCWFGAYFHSSPEMRFYCLTRAGDPKSCRPDSKATGEPTVTILPDIDPLRGRLTSGESLSGPCPLASPTRGRLLTDLRQMGHVLCSFNHLTMHSSWNMCLQDKITPVAPTLRSSRQTAQCACPSVSSVFWSTVCRSRDESALSEAGGDALYAGLESTHSIIRLSTKCDGTGLPEVTLSGRGNPDIPKSWLKG